LIEDEREFARLRRLQPSADEDVIRRTRDHLDDHFETLLEQFRAGSSTATEDFQKLISKWDGTLSTGLQLSPQKGVGTRRFVQTLSVSRSPMACKEYAYTAQYIAPRAAFRSEFAAITDVPLDNDNLRHRFVRDTLRDAAIEPIPMEGFAVWVAKLKPLLQWLPKLPAYNNENTRPGFTRFI